MANRYTFEFEIIKRNIRWQLQTPSTNKNYDNILSKHPSD